MTNSGSKLLTVEQMHCEYVEAFEEFGNYITRGLHFHEEALRLWLMEIGKPSLTNLQALAILAME